MRKSTSAITKVQAMTIAAVIIIAAIAAGAYFLLMPTTTPKPPIKVGLLLCWTGAGATQAAELEKGIKVWFNRITKEGGLLGREIKLVPVDSESIPDKARIGYERLVLQEQVDVVIGPFYSSEWMAVLPLVDQHKVPTIVPMATTMAANPIMANGTYAWRACGNNVAWATTAVGCLKDVIIPALTAKYGMKEEEIVWQLIRSDDEAARDVATWVYKFLDEKGIKFKRLDPIVMSFTVTDFTAEIRIIQGRKPDIVTGLAWGAQSAIFVKQCREYDSKFIVMGFGDIATSPAFWDATKEARVGSVGMAYYPIWTKLTPLTEGYVKDFIETHKATPSPASGQGYDACMVYEMAVKKAGTAEKGAVAKAIAQVDFVGIKHRVRFITDPKAYDSHDVMNSWFTMAQYQPTPSVIEKGTPLFDTTLHGLRMTLVWPTDVAEAKFWIPDYYVPSTKR